MSIDNLELQTILQKYGITGIKDLDLQLSDAQVFYDVGAGRATAGALMTCFLRMWPKETMDRVAKQLIDWLTATGYLQSNVCNGSAADKERISSEFIIAVERLCADAHVARKEWSWYAEQVGSKVAGNAEIIRRISSGNLADIEQFFAQVHARRVGCVSQVN